MADLIEFPEETLLGRRLIMRQDHAKQCWAEFEEKLPFPIPREHLAEFVTLAGELTWKLWAISIEEAGTLQGIEPPR